MSEYGKLNKHNPIMLEPEFTKHVMAMTEENLHNKADIAVELAYRDKRITELEAQLLERKALLDLANRRVEVLENRLGLSVSLGGDIIDHEQERIHQLLEAAMDSTTEDYLSLLDTNAAMDKRLLELKAENERLKSIIHEARFV